MVADLYEYISEKELLYIKTTQPVIDKKQPSLLCVIIQHIKVTTFCSFKKLPTVVLNLTVEMIAFGMSDRSNNASSGGLLQEGAKPWPGT